MADKKISQLPGAGPLQGTEQVELNQGGTSARTTLADIAAKIQIVPTISRKALAFGTYTNNSGFPVILVVVYSVFGLSGDTSTSVVLSNGYDDNPPIVGFADADSAGLDLSINGTCTMVIPNGQQYTLFTQDPGGAQPNTVDGHYWITLALQFVP
jgi:hypothetical protein